MKQWIGLVSLLGCVACGSDSNPGDASPVAETSMMKGDVVLITISGLRRDHVGAYGYYRDTTPVLDELAAGALVFDNASTPIPATVPGHSALFTGRHPLETGVMANRKFDAPAAAVGELFLAQAMAKAGYETVAFVGAAGLGRGRGVDSGFDRVEGPETGKRRAYVTTNAALAWLRGRRSEAPFFMWLHYADVLAPYEPPAEHSFLFQGGRELTTHLEEIGVADPRSGDVRKAHGGYDGELHYVDSEIGRFLAELHLDTDWESLNLIVTSDHGTGLGQRSFLRTGRLFEEHLEIPLIWKTSRKAGIVPGRRDAWMDLCDLAPSLAALLGLEFETGRVGRDVLAPGFERDQLVALRSLYGKNMPWGNAVKLVLRRPDWKLHLESGRSPRLFRLADDPRELSEISGTEAERVQELVDALRAEVARLSAGPALLDEDVEPRERGMLKELGFAR